MGERETEPETLEKGGTEGGTRRGLEGCSSCFRNSLGLPYAGTSSRREVVSVNTEVKRKRGEMDSRILRSLDVWLASSTPLHQTNRGTDRRREEGREDGGIYGLPRLLPCLLCLGKAPCSGRSS